MDYEQLGHVLESIHPGVTIADGSGVFRFVSILYFGDDYGIGGNDEDVFPLRDANGF